MGQNDKALVQTLPFRTDQGAGERARIGLLVLESDQTLEWEFRDLSHLPGVSVYHTRVANDLTVSTETLSDMASELPAAARLIPSYLGLAAIGYGCTSAATVIGEQRVAAIIAEAHPGVPSSNPLSAAKAALNAMGVRRLALLTPYPAAVTEAMQANFDVAGIQVTLVGSFEQENDLQVGRIDAASIRDAAIALGQSDRCDGVFISCTSLRAARLIPELENTIGKPVTASNHALAWHLLRLAGIDDRRDDAGRLFHI